MVGQPSMRKPVRLHELECRLLCSNGSQESRMDDSFGVHVRNASRSGGCWNRCSDLVKRSWYYGPLGWHAEVWLTRRTYRFLLDCLDRYASLPQPVRKVQLPLYHYRHLLRRQGLWWNIASSGKRNNVTPGFTDRLSVYTRYRTDRGQALEEHLRRWDEPKSISNRCSHRGSIGYMRLYEMHSEL